MSSPSLSSKLNLLTQQVYCFDTTCLLQVYLEDTSENYITVSWHLGPVHKSQITTSCLSLHWGVKQRKDSSIWELPNQNQIHDLKDNTFLKDACDTTFKSMESLSSDNPDFTSLQCTIKFLKDSKISASLPEWIIFVLHQPPNVWIKSRYNCDFCFPLQSYFKSWKDFEIVLMKPLHSLKLNANNAPPSFNWIFRINGAEYLLAAYCLKYEEKIDIHFCTNYCPSLLLHWGYFDRNSSKEWLQPINVIRNSEFENNEDMNQHFESRSSDITFDDHQDSLDNIVHYKSARISIPIDIVPEGVAFVLKDTTSGEYIKNMDEDFILCFEKSIPRSFKLANYESKLLYVHQFMENVRKKKESFWEEDLCNFLQSRHSRCLKESSVLKKITFEEFGELDIVYTEIQENLFDVCLTGCFRVKCQLHWGLLSKNGREWIKPPQECWPAETTSVLDNISCDSDFIVLNNSRGHIQEIKILIPLYDLAPSILSSDISGIVFVLREKHGSNWIKLPDGQDLRIRLAKAGDGWSGTHEDVVQNIIEAELEWGQMSLMHRYNLMHQIITNWEQSDLSSEDDADFWSWMFVWGRFAYTGVLDWQRNYNTRPRELASSAQRVNGKVAAMWLKLPKQRQLIRLFLSTLSRGGSQGQAIRDKILDIMHKHHIPEKAGTFYEQWHQKLHNNTTPDDIGICKAVIRYLKENGNQEAYKQELMAHGITLSKLASFERRITEMPYMVAHCEGLIHDLYEYLNILEDVHDSLQLKKSFEYAKPFIPQELTNSIQILVNQTANQSAIKARHTPEIVQMTSEEACSKFSCLSSIRDRLNFSLTHTNLNAEAVREILFLDISLEQQQGLIIQSNITFDIPMLVLQLKELLQRLSESEPDNNEIRAITSDWEKFSDVASFKKFGCGAIESARLLKSMVDRISRYIGDLVDRYQHLLGKKSQFIGEKLSVEPLILERFVDECLRGTSLLSISLCLKKIEPRLRNEAALSAWQTISVVQEVRGIMQKIDNFSGIQENVYEKPTIFVANKVNGEEIIPMGVQAILVRGGENSPDILSHVAVRARNSGVLLAVCHDVDHIDHMMQNLENKWVDMKLSKDLSELTIVECESEVLLPPRHGKLSSFLSRKTTQEFLEESSPVMKTQPLVSVLEHPMSEFWVISNQEFASNLVGAKSLNLSNLSKIALKDIVVPRGVALPFGCMQRVLFDQLNKNITEFEIRNILNRFQHGISHSEASGYFSEIGEIMSNKLNLPPQLTASIIECASIADASEFGSKRTNNSLHQLVLNAGASIPKCIFTVWSSVFRIEPWISLLKAKLDFSQIKMAVLIQELLPVKYAFVLHTKNPCGSDDEMYGEIVSGLGETLVGSYPGQALRFTMKYSQSPVVMAFPNKSIGLTCDPCLIFRSDSNMEDLESFAGAGLFESVTSHTPFRHTVRYAEEQLICDSTYRHRMLENIGKLAFDVLTVFNGIHQDIEGAILTDDSLSVVQIRPQV